MSIKLDIVAAKPEGFILASREEIPNLTGIRGIAALTVVGCHYKLVNYEIGAIAVDVFFVLSGYVLSHVYRNGVEAGSFIKARFARTIPVHVLTTTIIGLIGIYTGILKWTDILAGLVCFKIINPPTWSLFVEWFAYLLFPFMWKYIKKVNPYILIGAGVVAGFIGHYNSVPDFHMQFAVLRGVGEFTTGVGLYYANYRPTPNIFFDNRIALWLGKISYSLYLCHLLPMVIVSNRLVSFILTLGLASTIHRVVEVPARNWLRKKL